MDSSLTRQRRYHHQPVNDAPVAQDETVTTDEDTAVTVTLSATDVDGDQLSYTITGAPANGSATISGNEITYTPNADYNGSDQVSVSVSDGQLAANANVDITINPVNDAPVAQDETKEVNEDEVLTLQLSASDVDGDDLTFGLDTQALHGTASISSSGALVYTPDANYNGIDEVAFSVTDGQLTSAQATVQLRVLAVNDAPVASDATTTTDEDVAVTLTLSATDVDGDALTYTIVSGPQNGTAVISGSGLTYTPDLNYNGIDSLTFSASDGELTATAGVSLTINPVNDAPIAHDASATLDEDTQRDIALSATDVDGDDLTFTICHTDQPTARPALPTRR